MRTPIREMHEEAEVVLVKERILEMASRFYRKTEDHPNPLVRGITEIRRRQLQHKLPYEAIPLYEELLPRDAH